MRKLVFIVYVFFGVMIVGQAQDGIQVNNKSTGYLSDSCSVGYQAIRSEFHGFYSGFNQFDGYWAEGNKSNGFRAQDNDGFAALFSSPTSRSGAVVYIEHGNDSSIDLEFGGNGRISTADNFSIKLDADASSAFNQSFNILNSSGTSVASINEGGLANFLGSVCSANVTCSSDIRYKKNITPLSSSLSNLSLIKGVRYDWDQQQWPERGFSDQPQIGFIAQELEAIYPELVNTDEDGYKSVAYNKMTAVLVEAVKELNEKLDIETKKNEEMKRSADQLKLENAEVKMELEKMDQLEVRLTELERLIHEG